MGSFSRLIPYVLPHRRLFILSGVFGLVVALLWGTNLSVAFPIVKVLLQGQSIQEYANQESEWYRDEIAVKNSELDGLPAERLKERARLQGKIADQTGRLRQLKGFSGKACDTGRSVSKCAGEAICAVVPSALSP